MKSPKIFLTVFGILAAAIATVLLIGWGTYIPRPRLHEVRMAGSHFSLRVWFDPRAATTDTP